MIFKPSEKQFSEDIEGIGKFTFKFPTILDEIKIDTKVAEILGFASNKQVSDFADSTAYMLAALSHVIVEAPPDWDVDEIYKIDDLVRVYKAYFDKVLFFRGEQNRPETTSPGDGKGTEVLVSQEVQTSAV